MWTFLKGASKNENFGTAFSWHLVDMESHEQLKYSPGLMPYVWLTEREYRCPCIYCENGMGDAAIEALIFSIEEKMIDIARMVLNYSLKEGLGYI